MLPKWLKRAKRSGLQAWSELESAAIWVLRSATATRTDGGWLLNGRRSGPAGTFGDRAFGLFHPTHRRTTPRGLTSILLFDLAADGVTVTPDRPVGR